jgi:superfamily II DNA or RNA helicase
MIVIKVNERVQIQASSLPDEVIAELQAKTSHVNPAKAKMERLARTARGKKAIAFKMAAKKQPERIETWRIEKDEAGEEVFSVPRGAIDRVREALRTRDLAFTILSARSGGQIASPRALQIRTPNDSGLRWYQEEAIDAAIKRQNALLRAPTGSGKTTTALGIVAKLRVPTLIIVWSSALMEQWRTRLKSELGLHDDEIGQIGAGVRNVKPITLAMQQSLAVGNTAHQLRQTFGLVICDEVQRFAAATFVKVVDSLNSYYRIGISADETRSDGCEFLIYDVFGQVAHEVTRDDLIDAGTVLDVECRIVPTDFMSGASDHTQLVAEMCADEARNDIVREIARAEVADDQQVVVLTHRVEHATTLAADLGCGLMVGGNPVAFEETSARIKRGELRAVVGTVQAMGVGIDLPTLSRGVLATPIGSNRQLYGQIRGRLCRLGSRDAVLYVLWDRHVFGAAMVKRLISWNRVTLIRNEIGEYVDAREYMRKAAQ